MVLNGIMQRGSFWICVIAQQMCWNKNACLQSVTVSISCRHEKATGYDARGSVACAKIDLRCEIQSSSNLLLTEHTLFASLRGERLVLKRCIYIAETCLKVLNYRCMDFQWAGTERRNYSSILASVGLDIAAHRPDKACARPAARLAPGWNRLQTFQ